MWNQLPGCACIASETCASCPEDKQVEATDPEQAVGFPKSPTPAASQDPELTLYKRDLWQHLSGIKKLSFRNTVIKRKQDPASTLPDTMNKLSLNGPTPTNHPVLCLASSLKKMKLNPNETPNFFKYKPASNPFKPSDPLSVSGNGENACGTSPKRSQHGSQCTSDAKPSLRLR